MLLSSASPPVATPLEPCRVAPYVSVPSLRLPAAAAAASAYDRLPSFPASAAAAAAAFSAFDPALLSAAHQVSTDRILTRFDATPLNATLELFFSFYKWEILIYSK